MLEVARINPSTREIPLASAIGSLCRTSSRRDKWGLHAETVMGWGVLSIEGSGLFPVPNGRRTVHLELVSIAWRRSMPGTLLLNLPKRMEHGAKYVSDQYN